MIAFWILAPIMVAAALGILFTPKAVHAALLLAVVMISLAVLYASLEAPFLFAVQIIVYTGAILMLFLFVLMLVGVDASDSVVETIRGQRLWAGLIGLAFGLLLACGVSLAWPRAHMRLTGSAANLTNNRQDDIDAWALPGRAVFVALAFAPIGAEGGGASFFDPRYGQ